MDLTDWLSAAAASARDIASAPLGVSNTTWLAPASPLPDDLYGIYIPLLSDDLALQLGVLAQRGVCVYLAKALMGMGADEALDSEDDVFDAMGEVANMIAGGVKVRLADKADIRVGLPLALRGKVFPPGSSRSLHGEMNMDGNSVWLLVTGTRLR